MNLQIKEKFPKKCFIIKVEDKILYLQLCNEIAGVVHKHLISYDGKQITRRMLTPWLNWIPVFKNTHPQFEISHASYRHEYSAYRIEIWFNIFHGFNCGEPTSYKDRGCFSIDVGRDKLGETGSVIFDFKDFSEKHRSLFDPKFYDNDIARLKRALKNVDVIEERYNALSNQLDIFYKNMEVMYCASDTFINNP